MAELFERVPARLQGLWERTRLEIRSPSPLVGERPVRVHWLQSELWHADLRIALDRPDLAGVASLDDASDDQLRVLADQEAFAGITRVSGPVCSWLRVHDLVPGTALDVGRMRFEGEILVEEGLSGEYLEHWERVEDAAPPPPSVPTRRLPDGRIVIASGNHLAVVHPRLAPAPDFDPYRPLDALDRKGLLYRASLEVSLYSADADGYRAFASTHPWREGTRLDSEAGKEMEIASCA